MPLNVLADFTVLHFLVSPTLSKRTNDYAGDEKSSMKTFYEILGRIIRGEFCFFEQETTEHALTQKEKKALTQKEMKSASRYFSELCFCLSFGSCRSFGIYHAEVEYGSGAAMSAKSFLEIYGFCSGSKWNQRKYFVNAAHADFLEEYHKVVEK
jgi:hypothetical protein